MLRIRNVASMVVLSSLLISGGIVGCFTPKPSNEESGKLEEARAAAESAERKLSELRQERISLEHELEKKSSELEETAE